MVLFLLSKLKALRFPFDFMSEVATEIKGRRTSSDTDQRRRSIGASPDEIYQIPKHVPVGAIYT